MSSDTVSQPEADDAETGPISDGVYLTPSQRRIIEAGKLARAEQAALEREYGLQDGRTRRQIGPPGGILP